ncbi:hypothetical protein ACLESO_45995 [Pyxidicoccus sp. 3LG]
MHQLLLNFSNQHNFIYEPYNGAGGDNGIDGFAKNGGIPGYEGPAIFQFKWLWNGLNKGNNSRQIKDSIKKAAKSGKKSKHWILITPRDLTPLEAEWLKSLETPEIFFVHHWGQARIESLLRKTPSLFARYYPHEAQNLLNNYNAFSFKEFSLRYKEKVALTHKHLRTLGLPPETLKARDARTEIPLRDLFVPLQLSPEDRQEETQSLSTLLNSRRSCIILGDPGTGKSTLLSFISLLLTGEAQLEDYTPPANSIPLLVPLRDFARTAQASHRFSLLDYICSQGVDLILSIA